MKTKANGIILNIGDVVKFDEGRSARGLWNGTARITDITDKGKIYVSLLTVYEPDGSKVKLGSDDGEGYILFLTEITGFAEKEDE